MYTRSICVFLFAALCLCGCLKSKEDLRTVSGRILNAIDSTSIARTSFRLHYTTSRNGASFAMEDHSHPFTTDDAGRFSIEYDTDGGKDISGFICFPGQFDFNCFEQYSIGHNDKSLDVGDVYAKP